MVVAVIADTHLPRGSRRLPDQCRRRIGAADLVVHAGDFSTAAVYEELAAIGPELVGVSGNVDDAALRARLTEREVIERAGVRLGLIHDAGPARGRAARLRRMFPDADAVIFGHSHMPLHERDGEFQIFNPGSPTERRRAPTRSMGLATIEAGAIHFRHVALCGWCDLRPGRRRSRPRTGCGSSVDPVNVISHCGARCAASRRRLGAVAKERLKSPRARLFVALDLPDAVRDGLARWQARALADPALRPMRPEALHVTLCFLSYHQEKLIPRITEVVTSVTARPVELRFEPEAAPRPKGRPRLYALGARSEGAVAMQAELSDALEAQRFYKPEKRTFWPHVTVARVRSERLRPGRGERRGRGRPKRVAEPPAPLPEALTEPFGAVRVALYRSNLKPQGAEYASLAGVDLPSPEGQKR